jgi:hypothetical protein
LRELAESSELIIVGEFCSEAEPEELSTIHSQSAPTALASKTYKYMTVKEVFKGEVKAGEKIRVMQGGGVNGNNQVVAYDLTPMEDGESWLVFLSFWDIPEVNAYYCHEGGSIDRFPVPGTEAVREPLERAKRVISELESYLASAQKEKITREEYMEQEEDDGYYYYATDTKVDFSEYYRITAKGASDYIHSLHNSYYNIRDSVNPNDFGVFEAQKVNLRLYAEVLDFIGK